MSGLPSCSVDIDEFQRILIKGKKTIISYRIRVRRGEENWFVFHTEEQILNLAKTLQKPTMEGYMFKRSERGVPNWNKRYFRLMGNVLSYTHESFDPTQKSKTINLLNATIVATYDIPGLVAGRKFFCLTPRNPVFGKNMLDGKGIFEIRVSNQKTIMLKAPNHAEMIRWINELNNACKPERRRRFTSPMLLVRAIQSKPDEGAYTDQELVKKRTDLNTFLKKICECYVDSEILHSFLLVGKYNHVKYPQMRMMVEAMQTDMALIQKLHEDYGVPLNFSSEGLPFISKACRKGCFELVKYIITSESEPNAQMLVNKVDKNNNTPLYYACESGSLEIAHLLILHKAVPPTPAPTALGGDRKNSIDIGGERYEAGTEARLWTPLHHAATQVNPIIEEHVAYLDELVVHLTPILDAKDAYNQTAIHLCAKEGNAIMALMLLKRGANHNVEDSLGRSFLHLLASNSSKKGHKMMPRILDHFYQTVNSLIMYDRCMSLLDMRDNEGKTAIQYALEVPECGPHAALLQGFYTKMEDLKFSTLMSDLIWKYNTQSPKDVDETFASLVEFLCIALSVNDYHSDVLQLVKRSIDFRDRAYKELRKSKMKESECELYKAKLMEGIYPIIYTHFLKKKLLSDAIMNKCMLTYKVHATYRSYGIEEKFWRKMLEESRKNGAEVDPNDPEPPLVKQAIKILLSMPTKILPHDKTKCLDDIFQLFDCNSELDSKISILTYLLVRAADPTKGLQWCAETDYISTFSNVDISLLMSIRLFFMTSWMQVKNGAFYVDMVGSLESTTILDIKCLWQDLRKDKTSYMDIELLHSLFFACAHTKLSETKVVSLSGRFSDSTLNNHFMKNIVDRLQLEIKTTSKTSCEVKYGDFVDCSVFARIACSFAEINLDIPLE